MFMKKSSMLSEFYKKKPDERLKIIKEFAELTDEEVKTLRDTGALNMEIADKMIENVVGASHLPFGIATNFLINGKDYLIPMAIEEPSVVAAASNAAKLCREAGGITTSSTEPVMIGQIQITNLKDPEKAVRLIQSKKNEFLDFANRQDSVLVSLGGGARDLETRIINTTRGEMLIVHILVDVRDAMGANAVNTMAERLAPEIENLTGGTVRLKIISNLAVNRLARAKAVWSKKSLEESTKGKMKGEEVVEAILDAYAFAEADAFRCATHNKGIMNGIDAVVIATGNDFRAVEAGAHSYAAITGKYKPLTKYYKNKNGDLVGEIELPIAVGTVGGSTRTNPIAKIALKILDVKSAKELSEVMAAIGLLQNFAAIRALATEGIQKGHMVLHSRNIAIIAGAQGSMIDKVAKKMVEEKNINVSKAKEILENLK
jgi:hydroxymethylglutaryl-CoA reductase